MCIRDSYYAVVGAQTAEEKGQVLVFVSDDLLNWKFLHVMAKAHGNQGFMWECPNFAEFDGHEALILSPQGIRPEGKRYLNPVSYTHLCHPHVFSAFAPSSLPFPAAVSV